MWANSIQSQGKYPCVLYHPHCQASIEKQGTVIITEEINERPGQERVVVVYARISASENRPNLDSQAERLCAYCAAKGCGGERSGFRRERRTEVTACAAC
jgi:predicted site-specific integrase-resolvase